MEVKNINKTEYFTAVDGCRITELFGISTAGLKEVSLAYAIVKPKERTAAHTHDFLEIYAIVKGKGIMHLDNEAQEVNEGDAILIKKGSSHFIEAKGSNELGFYCICVPSFTEKGTKMK